MQKDGYNIFYTIYLRYLDKNQNLFRNFKSEYFDTSYGISISLIS